MTILFELRIALVGWLVFFLTGGCLRGVKVKAMDSGILVSGFELQSRY